MTFVSSRTYRPKTRTYHSGPRIYCPFRGPNAGDELECPFHRPLLLVSALLPLLSPTGPVRRAFTSRQTYPHVLWTTCWAVDNPASWNHIVRSGLNWLGTARFNRPMTSNTTPHTARRMNAPALAPPGVPLPADEAPSPSLRYYTPPPKPLASCERKRSKDAPAGALAIDTTFQNIVTMTAGHSGIGLSVMSAMLAWALTERGRSCALVDADFVGGCLDLLLGVERESGLRFSQVEAPLGYIEGTALNHDLLTWEGVRVLPYDPWNARQPDWWEVQAAVRALAQANDVVIVDAGQGGLVETVNDLRSSMHIVAAELSVIGLARAKTHRMRLDSWGCPTPRIVGVLPRGKPRGRGEVGVPEAEDYLTATVLGPVRPFAGLCGDVLEGLGIRSIPKGSRKAINLLADAIEQTIRPTHAATEPDW